MLRAFATGAPPNPFQPFVEAIRAKGRVPSGQEKLKEVLLRNDLDGSARLAEVESRVKFAAPKAGRELDEGPVTDHEIVKMCADTRLKVSAHICNPLHRTVASHRVKRASEADRLAEQWVVCVSASTFSTAFRRPCCSRA